MTTWQCRSAALLLALVPGVHPQPRELQFNRNLLTFNQQSTCTINQPPVIIPMTSDNPMLTISTGTPSYAPTETPTMGPTDSPTMGPTGAPVVATYSPTGGPTSAPTPPLPTCPYYSVDFSGYNKGDWITTQYRLSHSLIINVEKNADKPNCNKYSTKSGSTDSHGLMAARVFDTAYPGPCTNNQGCDPDLGSPHPNCEKYGYPGAGPGGNLYPGHGDGGDPDKQTNPDYVNCVPQGNVLIIDEGWDDPDDTSCGGVIQFHFLRPADVGTLGLLDIDDDKPVKVEVEDEEGDIHVIESPLDVGDNGMYEMNIGVVNATFLRVYFDSSGSVSYINYNLCPDPRRYEAPDFTSESTCETAVVYCEPAYREEWCGNGPSGLPNRWGFSNNVNTEAACYIGAGVENCDTNVGSVAGTVEPDYVNNKFKVTLADGWKLYGANFIAGPDVGNQVSSAWTTYPLGYDGYSSGGLGPGVHEFDYSDGMDYDDFFVGHMVVCADGIDPSNGINDGSAVLDPPAAPGAEATETLILSRDFEDVAHAQEWNNWRWSGAKTTSGSTTTILNPQDTSQTTNFLGFFGKYHSGGSWRSRYANKKMDTTYTVGNPAAIKLQFDLITLDGWEYDDETRLTINDKRFNLGQYQQDNSRAVALNKEEGCGSSDNSADCDIEGWKPNGEPSSKLALVSVTHFLGSNGQGLSLGLRGQKDAAHRFEIILPPYYYPNGELFLEFDINMSGKINNEAGAIDNIHIYGLSSMPAPGTRRLL